MRRYIVLLLITGTVWAQTDFDKLILKNDVEYLGEYSRTDKKVIYFKSLDAFAFQPLPINIVKVLQLKDGTFVINNGIVNKSFLRSKMSTSEKAVFDSKKWSGYPSLVGLSFVSSIYGTHLITEDVPDNLMFISSVASLAVPYFGLKNSYKNQIAKGSIEDFKLYEETYSKESIKNIIKGCVVLGLLAGAGYLGFVSTLNFGSFGSSSGHCCF